MPQTATVATLMRATPTLTQRRNEFRSLTMRVIVRPKRPARSRRSGRAAMRSKSRRRTFVT